MTLRKTREDKKDNIRIAYAERQLSRKLAGSMLKDLGYEEWEINLYLDDDQTGPDDKWYGDDDVPTSS